MYLIAGLGNIGEKYNLTRHNVGFLVIDKIIKNLQTSNINNNNFQSILLKSGTDLFAKPSTYMNNSGIAIYNIKEYYKINLENIIIIHDDLDLPFGTIKFKVGGGDGGHNGLKSIDNHIGKNYIRIRIGIDKPIDKRNVANYVLSNFSKDEQSKLEDIFLHVIKAINELKTANINEVKSKFTLKK